MLYSDALELLNRARKDYKVLKSKLRTTLERNGDRIFMRLVDTPIVEWRPNGDIQLNSNGWRTVTTKARYNKYLPSPWGVYQEKRIWYVHYGSWNDGKTWAFSDNMILHADGTVSGAASMDEIETQRDLEKRIKKYAKGYVKALFSGDVPEPSGGDCWYCLMRTEQGETLGDAVGNTDHLTSHMDDQYYVPSLLMNALQRYDVSQVARWAIGALWDGKEYSGWGSDIAQEQIRKSIENYMRHQFGLA